MPDTEPLADQDLPRSVLGAGVTVSQQGGAAGPDQRVSELSERPQTQWQHLVPQEHPGQMLSVPLSLSVHIYRMGTIACIHLPHRGRDGELPQGDGRQSRCSCYHGHGHCCASCRNVVPLWDSLSTAPCLPHGDGGEARGPCLLFPHVWGFCSCPLVDKSPTEAAVSCSPLDIVAHVRHFPQERVRP